VSDTFGEVMNDAIGVPQSLAQHERTCRRFNLSYPVHVRFYSGEVLSEVEAVSRNISTGGLLLECPVLIPQDSAIHFVISLSGRKLRPTKLTGEGIVVRVERSQAQPDFAIAVECKKSMTQIEPYLPS
jgi:hypothetical protein